MYNTGENEGANIQLERAREALGDVLGSIQDIRNVKLNTSDIGESIAFSVRSIFSVQNLGVLQPGALEHLGSAMGHLRNTLHLMQEAGTEEAQMKAATATIARVLAILYPVVRALEKIEEFKILEHSQEMSPYSPQAAQAGAETQARAQQQASPPSAAPKAPPAQAQAQPQAQLQAQPQAAPAAPVQPAPTASAPTAQPESPEPEATGAWEAPNPDILTPPPQKEAPKQVVVHEETDIRVTHPRIPQVKVPEDISMGDQATEHVAMVVEAAASKAAAEARKGQYHHKVDAPPKERPGASDSAGAVPIGAIQLNKKPVPRRRPVSSVPPAGAAERRGTPRRVFDADIGLQSGTNFFTGFSLDISSGGLFISTYDTLPVGAEVNVNFDLPNGPVLSLNGLVAWTREYNSAFPDMEPGIGVKFAQLTDDDQMTINRYIAANPPIFYEED